MFSAQHGPSVIRRVWAGTCPGWWDQWQMGFIQPILSYPAWCRAAGYQLTRGKACWELRECPRMHPIQKCLAPSLPRGRLTENLEMWLVLRLGTAGHWLLLVGRGFAHQMSLSWRAKATEKVI